MTLIRIGESLHCHIPSVQASARRWLCGDGPEREAGERDLRELVAEQVDAAADYLDVNVDNFLMTEGRDGALEVLGHILDLIVAGAPGTPACIDSSDPSVLEWGLRRWSKVASPGTPQPLLNSVAASRLEPLKLRSTFPFSVVGMLLERAGEKTAFTDIADPEVYHDTARFLFGKAREAGFSQGEVFFDPTVGPLGADTVGYTRRTFEGVRLIRADAAMKGVHVCIGLSNCSDGLPRRLGVNRAYLRVAMEYGVDAAILNAAKVTGKDLVDSAILKLVRGVVEAEADVLMMVVDYVRACREKKQG